MDHDPPLFRPEVLAERQTRWLGAVLLAPRLSERLFAAFALATTAAALALLFGASYTRKARVSGWLVPEGGLVQVFAPRPGLVTELDVREGSEVRKGDRLLVLSAEIESTARGPARTEVVRRLAARRDSLEEMRRERARLAEVALRSLAARIGALRAEEANLRSERAVQAERLELARRATGRQRLLHRSKLVADEQLQAAEALELEERARLGALDRARLVARADRLALEGERAERPMQSRAEIADIEREIAATEQALAEAEIEREIVVTAPAAGTVTALQVERGARLTATLPLCALVPSGARLEAHLFGPSRAVGFLHAGQPVLLRYEAYPYQKFGHAEGVVADLSRAAVSPAELPPHLAGLVSVVGTDEPLYRIRVRLARQSILAYGAPAALAPGMRLEADVLVERRRLYEWVLDPLYTLTGRWSR